MYCKGEKNIFANSAKNLVLVHNNHYSKYQTNDTKLILSIQLS